jgi:hypothetical protein
MAGRKEREGEGTRHAGRQYDDTAFEGNPAGPLVSHRPVTGDESPRAARRAAYALLIGYSEASR